MNFSSQLVLANGPILFAVLNWGLGHATRCEKLIDDLVNLGKQVVLASDGMALDYLRKRFPQLSTFELPPLHVRYPLRHQPLQQCALAFKFWDSVAKDNTAFLELVKKIEPAIIISDNRYGCYAPGYNNYIITHQINPEAPWYFRKPVQWMVQHWLRNFSEVWIPDVEGKHNLSGRLSRPRKDLVVRYLGNTSRFHAGSFNVSPKHQFVLCVLSGPEPHRSILEEKILTQLSSLSHPTVVVRGTHLPFIGTAPPNVQVIDLADTSRLTTLLCQTQLYIGRCGYSTLLDLDALGIKALLLPTPGQPEQEYLAHHHRRHATWFFTNENDLNLRVQIPMLLKEISTARG